MAVNVGFQEHGDFLWKMIDRGETIERVGHRVKRYDRRSGELGTLIASARDFNEYYMIDRDGNAVMVDPATGKATPFPELRPKGVGAIAAGPEGMIYLRAAEVLDKSVYEAEAEAVVPRHGR